MRHLDLCSGIGGFALAARWMGWETVGFAEIDEFASRVLEKHWPGVPNYGDIAAIPDGIRADLVTAGFPCQPYSVAGKQLGAEDDRAIWPLVIEVVRRVQPSWAVFENVSGIINMALDGVLSDLEKEGYEVGTVILPACSVNAPHRRDRVWIVAHAGRFDSDGRRGECGRSETAGTRDWITRSGEYADDVANIARDSDRDSQPALPVHAEMEVLRGAVAHPNSSGRLEQRRSFAVSDKQLTAECGRPCDFCGYEFDRGRLGKYGCPNCCGDGLDDVADAASSRTRTESSFPEKRIGAVGCGEDVAHSAISPDQQSESRTSERALSGRDEESDGAIANPDRQSPGWLAESRRQCGGGQLECGLGGDFARLPAELDRPFGSGPEFWDGDWERGIPRIARGVKDRAKRLKSLGNSIVPQVVYRIFRAIEDSRP